MSERALVVIPTYNESENVRAIVERVRAAHAGCDVLIVDDNSPDGTGEIADRLAADDAAVHVLHRVDKQGLGAAYRAGFRWGLEREYAAVVEMDADGSHQPEQLPQLLSALDTGAGLVIGSRWVRGGVVHNWPRHRLLLSRAGNVYTRAMLGIRVRDATAGFRAFRSATLRRIDLDAVESQGYCFQIDLTLRTVAAGATIVEVPITFIERERGESKMSGAIVGEALRRVTVWGVQRRLDRLRSLRRRTAT